MSLLTGEVFVSRGRIEMVVKAQENRLSLDGGGSEKLKHIEFSHRSRSRKTLPRYA